ncbi:MAG: shikimate kinase [Candidatus Omnitrophica bacterium]|nr:shikimate kinase [Candidatus Omnitrophota bacterium]
MKNIYLVGFMGVGKTVVGKIIADKLKLKFIETDGTIEKEEGCPITEIFATKGEQHFRQLESNLLKKISKETNLIVSCGGGLVCNKENLRILKETGTVFNLTAETKTIYERIKKYSHRPLLNVEDPVAKIDELMQKRSPYYKQAHHTIDTTKISPDEVSDKIIDILNG